LLILSAKAEVFIGGIMAEKIWLDLFGLKPRKKPGKTRFLQGRYAKLQFELIGKVKQIMI
jgi:hypothetical protein